MSFALDQVNETMALGVVWQKDDLRWVADRKSLCDYMYFVS